MNDMRKLVRILLIGMGFYFLLNILFALFVSVPLLLVSLFCGPQGYSGQIFAVVMYYIIFPILIIFLLIKKANFWAGKIVGSEETAEPPKVFWVPVAFRSMVVFAGLLCMFWLIPDLISVIKRFIIVRYELDSTTHFSNVFDVNTLAKWILQLVLGIYLLCGAPHFVKWHTRMILEQNKENTKPPEPLSAQQ